MWSSAARDARQREPGVMSPFFVRILLNGKSHRAEGGSRPAASDVAIDPHVDGEAALAARPELDVQWAVLLAVSGADRRVVLAGRQRPDDLVAVLKVVAALADRLLHRQLNRGRHHRLGRVCGHVDLGGRHTCDRQEDHVRLDLDDAAVCRHIALPGSVDNRVHLGDERNLAGLAVLKLDQIGFAVRNVLDLHLALAGGEGDVVLPAGKSEQPDGILVRQDPRCLDPDGGLHVQGRVIGDDLDHGLEAVARVGGLAHDVNRGLGAAHAARPVAIDHRIERRLDAVVAGRAECERDVHADLVSLPHLHHVAVSHRIVAPNARQPGHVDRIRPRHDVTGHNVDRDLLVLIRAGR